MARQAASFTSCGVSKSGIPWPRLTAPCWLARRVISRMTASVKYCTRSASIGASLAGRGHDTRDRPGPEDEEDSPRRHGGHGGKTKEKYNSFLLSSLRVLRASVVNPLQFLLASAPRIA